MNVTPLGRSTFRTSCEGELPSELRSNDIQVVCPLISGDSILEHRRSWIISAHEWLIFSIANFSFFLLFSAGVVLCRVVSFVLYVKCCSFTQSITSSLFLLTNSFVTFLVVVKRRCLRLQLLGDCTSLERRKSWRNGAAVTARTSTKGNQSKTSDWKSLK